MAEQPTLDLKANNPTTPPKAAKTGKPKKKAKHAGTAMAVHKPTAQVSQPAANQSPAAQMLSVIASAASNPKVNVDKMERLLAMQEKLMHEQRRSEFSAALVDATSEMPILDRRGLIVITDKNDPKKVLQSTPYTKYEHIQKAIKPILQRHNLVITHDSETVADGKIVVWAILRHRNGYEERTKSPAMALDTTGSKNNTQGAVSTTSYGKRITTVMALGMISEGEDDDGNQGKGEDVKLISQKQLADLIDACDSAGLDKRRFCEFMKIDGLAALAAHRYQDALAFVELRRTARDKG